MTPFGGTPSGRKGPFFHGRQPGQGRKGGSSAQPGRIITVPPLVPPTPPPPGSWPNNEPAGLTAVFPGHPTVEGVLIDGSNTDFDYTGQGGSDLGAGWSMNNKWLDITKILSTTSAGSRYPSVLRKNMFIGDSSGWNGVATIANFAATYEELYFRFIFRYSANWQINGGGEKLFMFGEVGGSGSSFYPGPTGSGVIQMRNQSSNSGGGGIWRSASVTLPKGEWNTIELHMVAQSVQGVADGTFHMWLNNVEITDFNLLSGATAQGVISWFAASHSSRLWRGLQLPLHWGGGGGPKTVNDNIDVSEMYLTGKEATS